MTRFLTLAALSSLALSSLAVTVNPVTSRSVISEEPPRSTGLDKILVIWSDTPDFRLEISDVSSGVKISRYSNLGGGYAEEVPFYWEGDMAVIEHARSDMGYIITQDDRNYCFWIVNYATRQFDVQSVDAVTPQDCNDTRISISGSGAAIKYYSIDGRPVTLSREINVDYLNLEWSEEEKNYVQVSRRKVFDFLEPEIMLNPPLYCNSAVTVSGDRFLTHWGATREAVSAVLPANGLSVETEAVQTNIPEFSDENPSNIVNNNSEGLGGSAPADITFTAYTTDAVIHNEWQISTDMEFNLVDYRFNQQVLDYTFDHDGTYYVRYVGSNSDGSCETAGEVYTVNIGASELRIPNAFSPNDDGINDVWKVAYRSLVSFKCEIFDRYGNRIISFTDPTSGWDGKRGGKKVSPGVYYYVIEAKGADGKKYKKAGDINIIGSKRNSNSSATNPVQ
ncbi:MAG: gliding motility-associated C-terminal domain-containing protein [Muribaculaceae bacterium]|nr:gliding motility-associated C-terminal domain-containing protein [Muribaculaceae bacterium]